MTTHGITPILSAIIVDDELHGRENLKMILEMYCPEIAIAGVAESVIKAKELVNGLNPDVVFLDINMPVLNGFDFLDEYPDKTFLTVFVSAHEEFGIRAVKAGASDYLLKPINIKELKQTVKKLVSLHEKQSDQVIHPTPDKLLIPDTHGFNVLETDNIIRMEADGSYTTVVMKNGKSIIVSRTLKEFEDSLPKGRFFRIHKSHLIQMKYIIDYSNLSGNLVTMIDGSRIELARRKTREFKQSLKIFLTAL